MSNHRYKLLLVLFLLATGIIALQSSVTAVTQSSVQFNRDIRPIFSNTCFACHGPDKNARKANLRLDLRDEATKKTKSGIYPIVSGKPEESEIITRIFATDASEIMPPPDAHKELTTQQKETIKRWVAEGARYEGHWAYQLVVLPIAPEIRNPQSAIRNPIDRFIQARLAKEQLTAAPEADKRTLIRRVALDLTGIPPTQQEIAAFVNDKSPDAYEKLVNRLLASDRYAEKQTMHWLDAVRYADTSGYHGDNQWAAWPYRDYVLRAFRDNKPFDEFTREQLAGDLLPGATNETRVASAYNRLNRVSAEGGLQPKEYLAKYGADRVRTTSLVWMGATMGCAECHDHKFDPYLAKDFYAMKAFFADIKETGLVPDRGRNSFGSKLVLPAPEQQRRFDELGRQLNWLRAELDAQAKTLHAQQNERGDWEANLKAAHTSGQLEWKFQQPFEAKAARGATLEIFNAKLIEMTQYRGGAVVNEKVMGDGLVVAAGANPEQEVYTVKFKPGAGEWKAFGLEVVQEESLPASRLGRGADRFVVTEFEAEADSRKLDFTLATTDKFGEQIENHAQFALDGNAATGWGSAYGDGRNAFIALRLAQPLKTKPDTVITARIRQESQWRRATIGRFRLALSAAEYSWPDHTSKLPKPMQGLPADVATALAFAAESRGEKSQQAVFNHFKWAAPELTALNQRINLIEAERDALEAQLPRVMVTEAMVTPATTRLLARGDFLDESGEVVLPAIPVLFGKLNNGLRRATRLDLADWLVSKQNPLTARVFVNRLWRQFFGTGLSKSLEDFGSQGEWPTHPELLDWLASEFMHPTSNCGLQNADCRLPSTHDWDVKHVIRLIVTSHTYRQASANPQSAIRNLQSEDVENRLLSRQNRLRTDAEIVRDIALSVSGLLNEQFGGASIRPPQPEGYLGALNFPKRDYSADQGAAQYRRGLYVHWQRTFLHPNLATFDAPSREECTLNRTTSNTPLQALVLLNDPIYVEAARSFAQNALRQGGVSPTTQIAWAFERVTGRLATTEEKRILLELYQQNLKLYQSDAKSAQALLQTGETAVPKAVSPTKLAAMMNVTRALLNLHETITRN